MKRSTVKAVSVGLVLILLASVAALLVSGNQSDYPAGSAGPEVTIAVKDGESGSSIALQLQGAGVVQSSKSFNSLALKDSRSRGISPGNHRIESHIPVKQALDELLDPARNTGLIRVIEGMTVSDVTHLLSAANITGRVGQEKVPDFLGKLNSYEGTLFPATYAFAAGTSTHDALAAMIDKFQQTAFSIGLDKGANQYSPYEILKIASLIQIEGDLADYAKVARVIYNRLKIGMALQLNSTVQYANNSRGKIALSRKATMVNSPFNTYIHVGLPPTPISNPGRDALLAAMNPAAGDWLYFITVKPHDTRFTKNFDEFQSWVALYNKNLAAGAFK